MSILSANLGTFRVYRKGRELQVTTQPFEAEQNQILQPPFQVELLQNGFLDAGLVAGEVVATLLDDSNGAVLGGTLTRPLQRGIATFPELSINRPGVYRLQFSCQEAGLRYLDQPRTDVRWYVSGVPTSYEYVGYWVHWSGPGVPMGIWAKIVRIHIGALGSYWEVSQPVGATDLLNLINTPLPDPMVIGYNEADPYLQPLFWQATPSTPWIIDWEAAGNLVSIDSWTPETGTILCQSEPIEILQKDEGCCVVFLQQGGCELFLQQGGCELELDAGNPEIVLRFNCK